MNLGPTSPRILALYAVILLASLNIATYASLLPELSRAWQLNNTQAGSIGSAYFLAYTVAVPILTTLTDRISAKLITLIGLSMLATGAALFGTIADDFQSACIAHALMGFGFAGTYMPGLTALSDHVDPQKLSRSTAFYTSSFTIATGLSYVLVTWIASNFGWRMSFLTIAAAAALAFCIVAIALPRRPPEQRMDTASKASTQLLANLKGAATNRTALGYSIGYFLHCWELFAMRTWVVAFLGFAGAATMGGATTAGLEWLIAPASIAALMTVLGFFASILGNELSMKIGRVRAVTLVTLSSSTLCAAIAFSVSAPYAVLAALCFLHGATSLGESASVTAGALGSAHEGQRGATMALHSTVGFAGGFFGPLVFGLLLDAAPDRATGWMWGFLHLAAIIALTSVALRIAKPVRLAGDTR